ncbi:MAG TPA: hypothetical protein VFY18_13325, partial [Candidatus Limnocylindrales bacterium]|nr:hypothetical protein [Candidatus Limnocylindrales bacterium]
KSCQVLGCGSGIVNAGRAIAGLAGLAPIVGLVAPAVRYPFPGSSLIVTAVAVDVTHVDSAALSIDGDPPLAMTATDGAFGGISESVRRTITAPASEGDHEICVRATDPGTNTSDGTACTTITVDAGPPNVGAPVPMTPTVNQNPVVAVTASATDGVAVASADLRIDGGAWLPMHASDGVFGEGSEALQGTVGGRITQLSAGNGPTCALLENATVRCWGWNQYGQLGDGTTTDRPTPVAVSGLSNVVQIAAGSHHVCALLADTTVRCWGYNGSGALGDGTMTDSPVPVTVSGLSDVTSLTAMDEAMCALLEDATVRCWGQNGNGEVGDGTTTNRLTPVPVGGLAGVTAITGGAAHVCALLLDTTVRCWGFNPYGGVGDGSIVDRRTPVTVSGLSTVTALGAGYYHSCARLANATVKCWGDNYWGQIGDGTSTERDTPVLVPGLANVSAIAAGGQNTCALLSNGTARCWGANTDGQVGDGTLFDRHTPVAVTGLTDVAALEVGGGDSCALLADATARCWGVNFFGEVGDGTTTHRLQPVPVVGIGALSGGKHSLCVRATDTAGHMSDGSDCSPLTVAAPTAQLTAPATPTTATTLTWTLTFGGAVTGLAATDFTRTGTAPGCIVGSPAGSGTSWTVAVTGCGQGTVAIALKRSSVVDAAGNRGPAFAIGATIVTIDRTGPTTSVPSVSPRIGTALGGTAIPVTVDATGTDTGGAGIARYELARSTDGGTTWTTLSTTLTTPTYLTTVPASGTVRYRVRAVDLVGNMGLWTTGPVLTPGLVQQTAGAVQFAGAWATVTSTAYSGGSARASSVAGASATFTFTGRSIALVSTKAAVRSTVRIYVDGTLVATIYPYASPTAYRIVTWQQTWTTSATRVVKLVVAGPTGRPHGDLDAFAILQ